MANVHRVAESVVPAQLSFLTLYNPSLGRTDETIHDQVVFYHSSETGRARTVRRQSGGTPAEQQHEEQNERLRQIGLAQGMVEFAKAFSNGENIDSIESEKSRILLRELEPGWWILASVDLTRLQSVPQSNESSSAAKTTKTLEEYSSREVCPQALLLQHLLRAHSIFLLHHAPSLAELYARLSRQKFCAALERFWNKFVRIWDVLLHGNPAVDVFNGLKLAAGGELGIGVGEEEWGSGEREVLEGFVERTEGLVDLVVSRFGEGPNEAGGTSNNNSSKLNRSIQDSQAIPWLGAGSIPRASDGVVFSGTGAIARPSLKAVSAWMEWLYKYGLRAYGVQDNVHSALRKKRRKVIPPENESTSRPENGDKSNDALQSSNQSAERGSLQEATHNTNNANYVGIPPPIVKATNASLADATSNVANSESNSRSVEEQNADKSAVEDEEPFPGADAIVKYMTLGVYGSSWGIPLRRPKLQQPASSANQVEKTAKAEAEKTTGTPKGRESTTRALHSSGHNSWGVHGVSDGFFLIGLSGDLENDDITDDESEGPEKSIDQKSAAEQENWNTRVMVRTLYLERSKQKDEQPEERDNAPSPFPSSESYDRLRVVVYVYQPFIFTFLFTLPTPSLSLPSFYHSLHHQLGPLQRPLLTSTSPSQIAARLSAAASPTSTATAPNTQPIYDLVYDPANLSVHTTIPNIPDPGTAAAEGLGFGDSPWTRIEALNVHSQILHTVIATRRHAWDWERTCKTSRGWWVVWMRLPPSTPATRGVHAFREAVLVRKASDYVPPKRTMKSGLFGREVGAGSAGWGPGKLAEGIGIDPRRYVEGLLSLNR